MKTTTLKKSDIKRTWYLIDAKGVRLGKLATKISSLLLGKHKSNFVDSMDCGDNVVIINSKEVDIHPSKVNTKMYYRHSGYPGGLTTKTFKELHTQKPNEIIKLAVKGMLPKNKLITSRLKHLYIYEGVQHNHDSQKPEKLDI